MNKIDTVLFDFDGTVMDTNNVILMSWQHTFKTLRGREEDREVIVKTFGEPLELINLFPGMRELLAEVKRRGYKTGLVTSRLYNTTMQGLEKYEIKDMFDAVLTADDTDKHKPDPAPINITLEKLGSSPETSIMLGDTLFDLLCAKNAGVRSTLVSWSLALHGMTKEDLGEAAPDYIIQKPEELLEIIA